MKVKIEVPPAGESVSEATVSQILKENGQFVKADEEILELETEKVNQILYAPAEGLLELTVAVDQTVVVGQVIGTIDTEGKGPLPKESSPSREEGKRAEQPAPLQEGARKSKEEYLSSLQAPKKPLPSHPPLPQAPRESSSEAPPAKEEKKRRRMSGLRKTIASRLVEAKNKTAMLTTFAEVDMSNILAIRKREQEVFVGKYGVKLGFMSFFVKAVSSALKEFPDVNSYIENEEIVTFASCDICIAVSTEKGLMVPVVRSCEEKSFGQIEQEILHFAQKAREWTISIEDMRGGSFTITNGGVFGSMLSTPILNPPQSGILGMHTIVKRAVVVEDQIVIRPMMYLALSYDHRIIDGREAIQFLVHVKGSLEEPTRMLIDL